MGKVISITSRKEVTDSDVLALARQSQLRNLSKIARDLQDEGNQDAAMHVTAALELLRDSMADGYKTFLQDKQRQAAAVDTVESV